MYINRFGAAICRRKGYEITRLPMQPVSPIHRYLLLCMNYIVIPLSGIGAAKGWYRGQPRHGAAA